MTRLVVGVLASSVIASLSCTEAGHSVIQPSSPLSPEAASPRLVVKVDGQRNATAIQSVSEVTLDASATPGDKLKFEIQFGDGQSVTTPLATHVYRTEGTFVATLTVTDAAGRQASASEQIVIRSLKGSWFNAGINTQARRIESHRITITQQDGIELRGAYSFLGERDQPLTGQLGPNRHIKLIADGGTLFEGELPTDFPASTIRLTSTSPRTNANGQVLEFKPVPEEPPGTAPRARLNVRSGVDGSNFTSGPLLWIGWESTFDSSESTGEGLAYFIDFGDGDFAQEALARHVLTQFPSNLIGQGQARAVVVDRFGRVDAATQNYRVGGLAPDYSWAGWWSGFENPVEHRFENRRLRFLTQEGSRVTGTYTHPEGWDSPFTGKLTGGNMIALTLNDGTIELTGTLSLVRRGYEKFPDWFLLKVRGGSADGNELVFQYYDPF